MMCSCMVDVTVKKFAHYLLNEQLKIVAKQLKIDAAVRNLQLLE